MSYCTWQTCLKMTRKLKPRAAKPFAVVLLRHDDVLSPPNLPCFSAFLGGYCSYKAAFSAGLEIVQIVDLEPWICPKIANETSSQTRWRQALTEFVHIHPSPFESFTVLDRFLEISGAPTKWSAGTFQSGHLRHGPHQCGSYSHQHGAPGQVITFHSDSFFENPSHLELKSVNFPEIPSLLPLLSMYIYVSVHRSYSHRD